MVSVSVGSTAASFAHNELELILYALKVRLLFLSIVIIFYISVEVPEVGDKNYYYYCYYYYYYYLTLGRHVPERV